MGSFGSFSPRRLVFIAAVILVSGVSWLFFWQLSQSLLHFTQIKTGITLVYVPAGIRLVILLVAGLWGGLGIILAFPFAVLQEFPAASWTEVMAYSFIAGIVPYAAVLMTCKLAKVSRDLSSLRSFHLPLLAVTVSLAGAFSYLVALVAFDRFPASAFLQDFTALAAGDFLGCFVVVLLVRLVLASRR